MKLKIFIAVVLCAASFTIAAAQPPRRSQPKEDQEAPRKSIIRGRVLYADTGRPLRRAQVSIIDQDTNEWLTIAITDRNGEFVFSNVRAGKYFLTVAALDIVSPAMHLGRNESLKLRIALGQIEDGFSEVTVDGRSSAKTEIRASRGGVITGRVLTDDDEPIAKAQISVFRIEKGNGRVSSLTESAYDGSKWRFETDSRGVYRIAGLATGDYIVRASESNEGRNLDESSEGNYGDGSMMIAFYQKALRVQDATTVKVHQGSETTEVDIRLPDRVAHRVSGTVLVRGVPARSATIQLKRDDSGLESYRHGSNQTSTDVNGNWEFRAVPDGNYTLVISGMGGHTSVGEQQRYVVVTPLRRKLIVAGGDIANLKFELNEGGTVAGTVSLEGGISRLKPLTLELVPADKPAVDGDAVVAAYVSENGSFSLSGLPSGLFHFRISELGPGIYVKSITFDGKDVLRNPIKTYEEKLVDGVQIVLSADLVTLAGRAVEKNAPSKPLTNATVLLFPVEAERRLVSDGPLVVRTDKDGRFVVKGPPGEYLVFVFERGPKDGPVVMPAEAHLVKNSSTLQKVSLQRGGEKIVEVVGP